MPTCPTCARAIEEDAAHCPHDGSPLRDDQVRAVSARDRSEGALAEIGSGADSYDALIGATLDGRYRIEARLGEGGMGIVFLGRHTVIEKAVAIKVLKREVAREQSVAQRFVQEAKAASRIGHANIVDVTDFGTTPEGMTYSVMEYVEGETLHALLRREAPLPVWRALPIVEQIGRALASAHAKGIVHRDLKPENVFLLRREGRDDFVKIVDFGIAKVQPASGAAANRLTRAGSVFGTPEYMAPEQAAGKSDTDHRVDIYALGTLLYEMVVGRVPHKGDSPVRLLAMQMMDPIPPPRELNPQAQVPDALETVMLTALAKDRDQRYASMDALVADLEGLAGGIPEWQPLTASSRSYRTADSGSGPAAAAASDGAATWDDGADTVRETPGGAAPARPTAPPEPARKETEPVNRGGGRRWLGAAAALAVFVGGGAAAALLSRSGGDEAVAAAADAATGTAASAAVAAAPADAAPPGRADAAPPPDATAPTRRRPPRDRARRPEPRTGRNPEAQRPVEVRVMTLPEGGTLYIGGQYAGSHGTTLRRDAGTSLTIVCKLSGHEPGRVEVTFDGSAEAEVCRMKRNKKCVDGIKNPFEDCP